MNKLNEFVYLDMDLDVCNELVQSISEQNEDKFNVLIQETVQVQGRDSNGYGVLHQAARVGSPQLLAAVIDRYRQLNMDLDDNENSSQTTALHLAVQSGDAKSVVALIEAGASPAKRDINGADCLHIAARYNRALLVFYFLKCGISVNTADNEGVPIFLKTGCC
jgi:ankyrin repeat protein